MQYTTKSSVQLRFKIKEYIMLLKASALSGSEYTQKSRIIKNTNT